MNLDFKLTKLGLKHKKMVVLDVSFPDTQVPEFKRAYPHRFLHLPSRDGVSLEMAAGMASLGKHVLIVGSERSVTELPEQTLNVKLLREGGESTWWDFEAALKEFAAADLLIPPTDSRILGADEKH